MAGRKFNEISNPATKDPESCMKAAVQNFPPAENMTGNLYYNGRGVEKDKRKATEWTLKKSAALLLAVTKDNPDCR